jgi:hypothetical protein
MGTIDVKPTSDMVDAQGRSYGALASHYREADYVMRELGQIPPWSRGPVLTCYPLCEPPRLVLTRDYCPHCRFTMSRPPWVTRLGTDYYAFTVDHAMLVSDMISPSAREVLDRPRAVRIRASEPERYLAVLGIKEREMVVDAITSQHFGTLGHVGGMMHELSRRPDNPSSTQPGDEPAELGVPEQSSDKTAVARAYSALRDELFVLESRQGKQAALWVLAAGAGEWRELALRGDRVGLVAASVFHPRDGMLYVAAHAGAEDAALRLFRVDPGTGLVWEVGKLSPGGRRRVSLAITPADELVAALGRPVQQDTVFLRLDVLGAEARMLGMATRPAELFAGDIGATERDIHYLQEEGQRFTPRALPLASLQLDSRGKR